MINKEKLETFLGSVDNHFPTPLSQKQELSLLAEKFMEKATMCYHEENGEILALVAGYTQNVTADMGYISVVATLPEAQGKGYASRLVKEFIEIATDADLSAVHLYTAKSNLSAIAVYKKLGFTEWVVEGETRPDDLHLIFSIKQRG